VVELGHYSLAFALAAAGWALIASLLSTVNRGRGLQYSAERGLLASGVLIFISAGSLIYAFLTDNFQVEYVYHYSSSSQALSYKIGALWGGQAGSLLFWVMILAVMAAVMVLTNREKNRALMPYATAVVSLTMVFFLILVNFLESPFKLLPHMPTDGVGLNPQLKNYWMMIHPPFLYLGYVGFTIPFAFAVGALATRRTGDLWFRTTRRWTLFSWFFLGIGILMGSYWAYIELGWGGYWAWDPVENASLMPWLTGTAFLHSVMIQERKGMLKVWNVALIMLTFNLSIFGTFLTRSGVISSVHAFATSNIGPAFGIFLGLTFLGSMLLLIMRIDDLRSDARLESLVSRESSFLFNNMILVGIAATVLLLTTFPMFSELVTGRKVTMGPPIFNLVNIPWALFLLLLTGVGPLIAWRKATAANLKRNFTFPALTGLWFFLAMVILDWSECLVALRGLGTSLITLDVRGWFEHLKVFYPALTLGLGAFVIGTVVLEFHRGIRARRRQRSESSPVALGNLVWNNKRRYGGYVVHVGMVLIFIGIAGSSAYQKEALEIMNPGESLEVDGYTLRYDGYRFEAVDDHIGAVTEMSLFLDGTHVGNLEAEQRFHPNMIFPDLRDAFERAKSLSDGDPVQYHNAVVGLYGLIQQIEARARREVKTPSTEVAIHSSFDLRQPTRFAEDFYVIPLWVDPASGEANIRVFVNPMVNFIWLGGLVVVLGAHLAVLPDARERRRLRAALAMEEKAVA
jgi:cytochrome c-type biogenesis protein CcmF